MARIRRQGVTVGTQFTLGQVHETVAAAVPERECLVQGARRFTYRQLTDRSRQLASLLHDHGLGVHRERRELANHESGQDHLGLYLYNGNEYIEGMLGAYKARVAPFNVNYRYVEEELLYLLDDAAARGLVFHSTFAPTLQRVLPKLAKLDLLLQVEDGSGNELLPGALDYETALASYAAELPPVDPSPDDLYILYTGGTTGMPKGVLWRQNDIFMAAMGGREYGTWKELADYEDLVARIFPGNEVRILSIPPLIHGAAQWACFYYMSLGSTVLLASNPRNLQAAEIWKTVERERVLGLTVVGDAMARPLLEELEQGSYDTSSLLAFGSGGAILSEGVKQRLLAKLPNILITDVAGASETGGQMGQTSVAGSVSTGRFAPGPGATVVNADLTMELKPGDTSTEGDVKNEDAGWLAQRGWIPLGYMGDASKTAKTFPVIGGRRFSIPGDRARLLSDGQIELLGRDSVTINSGGEKIFAEEVEQAILRHPAVADVVVAGRPSERWGQEVVALVQVADGHAVTAQELLTEAGNFIARYKLPKAVVLVPKILRSPAGKPDYRWAKEEALRS